VIVMPSNNCKAEVHYWQGKYGGLGHLYAPGGERGPYRHLPYALDNGAFGAFSRGDDFDAEAFTDLLEWAAAQAIEPLWVVVPDVVGDAKATLEKWQREAAGVRDRFGFRLALAVQDGMRPSDVRELKLEPDVIFVGGSTRWKWESLPGWCATHPRVHVGRCNRPEALYRCAALGVESCDGTGWFRGDPVQTEGLRLFLERQSRGRAVQHYDMTREPLFTA